MVVLIFKQLLVADTKFMQVYSNIQYYNDWQLSIFKKKIFQKKSGTEKGKIK